MLLPLWGKLVALSVGKKVTVLLLAKVYGIPRLYRKSLRATRLIVRDQEGRRVWTRRIEGAFRLPDTVLAKLKGLGWAPPSAAQPKAPGWAGPLAAARVPSLGAAGSLAAARRQQPKQAAATRLRHLALSFRQQLQTASLRVRSSAALARAAAAPSSAPSLPWSPHPFGSFAAQPVLGRAHTVGVGVEGVQQMWQRAQSLRQSVAARGREYLERAALRQSTAERRYWQRGSLAHV